jgi:hypothetical protein
MITSLFRISILAIILFLGACSTSFDKITSEGPENQMTIEVSGTKVTAEPIQVHMVVSLGEKKHESDFEVFSSDLNLETVKFNWAGPTECKVVFDEWDESPRTILVKTQMDGLLIKALD